MTTSGFRPSACFLCAIGFLSALALLASCGGTALITLDKEAALPGTGCEISVGVSRGDVILRGSLPAGSNIVKASCVVRDRGLMGLTFTPADALAAELRMDVSTHRDTGITFMDVSCLVEADTDINLAYDLTVEVPADYFFGAPQINWQDMSRVGTEGNIEVRDVSGYFDIWSDPPLGDGFGTISYDVLVENVKGQLYVKGDGNVTVRGCGGLDLVFGGSKATDVEILEVPWGIASTIQSMGPLRLRVDPSLALSFLIPPEQKQFIRDKGLGGNTAHPRETGDPYRHVSVDVGGGGASENAIYTVDSLSGPIEFYELAP